MAVLRDVNALKDSFNKFFDESPFKNAGDQARIAMWGAYMAGFTVAQEDVVKYLNDTGKTLTKIKETGATGSSTEEANSTSE